MKTINKIEKSLDLGGRKLTLTTGHMAYQADSAVYAQYGDTVVLVAVVSSPLREDLGYFPLSVEYMEKLYAGGKIKGSRWVKREGRPTDEEILIGRLIDRSIRPLFPEGYKKEVQVTITVMSVDLENSPDMVAAIATSAALAASSIPWMGPIGVVKVGLEAGKYITNPTLPGLATSEMELVVSTTKDAIVMIEAGAKEVAEEKILEGIAHAQTEGQKVIDFINDFAKEVGREKETFVKEKSNTELAKKIKKVLGEKLTKIVQDMSTKDAGYSDYDATKKILCEELKEEDPKQVGVVFEKVFKEETRRMIFSGKRPDGRKLDEVRPLSAQVGVLPRTHGTGLFQRGLTQVLTVATLGAPSMGQLLESAEGETEKRYIHHYAMPPFSTGETGRVGFPGRREIGHGALAERALLPVIPSDEKFPYAIRLVSEVLSCNGSTSMASTCGSTLALMDAGVPIKSPVAGIAMGVIVENPKEYAILTDIAGVEDGNGDMDFKVAGTKDGITALQMDVKTLQLTREILEKALAQAKVAREAIMKVIVKAIAEPRAQVSTFAPKIKSIKIPVDKIGELIGPGGKNIKRLMADTGTQVDVDDDGTVAISAIEDGSVEKAYAYIEGMIKEVVAGEIYDGVVKRIQPFGAFVEILPGKEGMVHVSDMKEDFVSDPNEVVALGDHVQVRVKEIDEMKRINLSMLLDPSKDKPKGDRGGGSRGGPRGGFGDRGPRRFNDRGGGSRGFGDRGPRRDFRSNQSDGGNGPTGPHFPVSRYLDEKKFSR